jgi:aldehyde:ferredoxin oxidoreductase
VDDQINLLSYATGIDLDEDKAILIAQRINALIRAYNVRKGINRSADIKIPERFFREKPAPPDVKLDHKKFNKMVSSYYKLRGWNYKGIPAKNELERLGLHDVWQDLEQRGYYKR